MKILFTGLLLIFSIKSISQPKLTGSEVDNWNLEKGILPISFDRASVYIYLINPNSFSNILQGIEYSPEERRLLGIRRNDKPDFLNISISINHPEINSGDKLQIPLLLYDFRDQKHSQTFQNYGGKYLNNINDENLKNSIMGQVDVQAFISNSNVQFWKEVAGITAKLGKSATALLTNKSFEISQQASNLIKTGMDKLGNLDNGDTNAEWSFFVKLIDYSKSQFYNEKVTAARLYQIHWNNQNATNQNFFDFDENVITEITPDQFSEKIINQNVPYILFVETRLEYQINLGIPSFTTEYKSNIAGKWNDIRDGTRREMAIKYYTLFNTAFEVYQKLNEFNDSALSGKIDYSLLARIIDGYYTFSNDLKAEKQLRSSNDIFKKKYSHRYKSISIQIDNKFASLNNSINVNNSKILIEEIFDFGEVDIARLSKSIIYDKIKRLSFYRDIINALKNDGITTNKFTLNESYKETQNALNQYETKLMDLLENNLPEADSLHEDYYAGIIRDYSDCEFCKCQSRQKINQIQGRNLINARQEYSDLRESEWNTFKTCKDSLTMQILSTNIIYRIDSSAKIETSTKISFKTFRYDYIKYHNLYESSLNNSTENKDLSEITQWMDNLSKSKEEIINLARRFINYKMVEYPKTCHENSITLVDTSE